MNETLTLVWACIAIIGIIAIIIVKLYFKDKESEEIDFSDITTKNPLQEMVSEKEKENNNIKTERTNPISNYFSNDEPEITLKKEGAKPDNEFNPYIVPERSEKNINRNISYSSQNQVLINYDNTVQKFQEPITETQRDIMNKNNENPDVTFKKTTELKDLFTIDELIKESKRKDDEREKESKTINKETEDNSDIKESIKKNQEIKNEETDITDIKSSIEKMHEIAEAIKSTKSEDLTPQSVASQKDIAEAIDSATKEPEKEEVPEISESTSITDAVIKKEPEVKDETTVQETLPIKEESVEKAPKEEKVEKAPKEEKVEKAPKEEKVEKAPKEEKIENISEVLPEGEKIKSPTLKTPTKVEEDSISILPGADEDYEFGASIDSSNLFEDENGELSDLDYRKDLARFTNTIKNSGIVKDIREKLAPEPEEEEGPNEEFIRNVGSYTEDAYETYDDYDDWAPIINETHVDYLEPDPEEDLRQANTRKVFENAKNNSASESLNSTEELIPTPKAIPEKSSLKVIINNNEEVLRKGDEIIYNHEGETYSSKVYSINGDDIKVKYRRQDITIKPGDIKKIY